MKLQFYEKPGCINNTKQKALLIAAGHELEVHSILSTAWSAERLRPFFGNIPVKEWFNPAAPRITSGEIDPKAFSDAEAIAAMLQDKLLIRRPLISGEGVYSCGFDNDFVSQLIHQQDVSHLQNCPNKSKGVRCD